MSGNACRRDMFKLFRGTFRLIIDKLRPSSRRHLFDSWLQAGACNFEPRYHLFGKSSTEQSKSPRAAVHDRFIWILDGKPSRHSLLWKWNISSPSSCLFLWHLERIQEINILELILEITRRSAGIPFPRLECIISIITHLVLPQRRNFTTAGRVTA